MKQQSGLRCCRTALGEDGEAPLSPPSMWLAWPFPQLLAKPPCSCHQLWMQPQEARALLGWKREPECFPSRSPVQRGAGWAGASGADVCSTKTPLRRACWCSGCCVVLPRGQSSSVGVKRSGSISERVCRLLVG